jgi:hypothetical protein
MVWVLDDERFPHAVTLGSRSERCKHVHLPVLQEFFLIVNADLTLLPTLIPLSGVGTTCPSSCCDKDSAFIFTTGRLPDVNWDAAAMQLGPTA